MLFQLQRIFPIALLGTLAVVPSPRESVLHTFQGGGDGQAPAASLIADKHGSLYGTSSQGGSESNLCRNKYPSGCGTVFKLTPSRSGYVESQLYVFRAGSDGVYPAASLVADKNGALYGTTEFGGSATCYGYPIGCGTVFKLTPHGSAYAESVIYTFQGGNDGAYPVASLIVDASSALYGTTSHGGNSPSCTPGLSGCGTVFKLTPAGTGYSESILYAFQGGPPDAAFPQGSLLADKAGALYGTSSNGGNSSCYNACGTVFKLAPNGSTYAESILYNFQGGSDGQYPFGNLIADKTGALFGTTQLGGSGSDGTVFVLNPAGSGYSESILYSFSGHDGAQPLGGLIPNGASVYTTTSEGGSGACSLGCGTVVRLTPTRSGFLESIVYGFQGGLDGFYPAAGLIVDKGALYGTTQSGGFANDGIVFKVTP